MSPTSSGRLNAEIPVLILAALALLAQPGGNAVAAGSPSLYLGAAIGQSHVESTTTLVCGDLFPTRHTGEIDKRHAAFKVMLGARPISWLGAEIDYIDFGKPSGTLFGFPADASLKGAAAVGVLYLAVSVADLYLKGGVARL